MNIAMERFSQIQRHRTRLALVGFGCAVIALLMSVGRSSASAASVEVSGIYPSLAMFNEEGECGTGAVVPWAERLWVVTYAPHKPKGSSDKLYEITPALKQIIRPESIGGTPANRMIHRESQQLFIGPYVIAADGTVRVIPYAKMFGRLTSLARHLTDPTNKIVFATMEEGIYEVDVHSLAVKQLWADEQVNEGRKANLPGYHGKGFYSAQGRYVYANNGDHAQAALSDPTVASGVLAEWDGSAGSWTVVRRNQFTDITGPGGITGNPAGDDRLWSIGWDNRSLILMLLEGGEWHAYRLPKASHCYDGAHGWNTEWPRIREIGEDSLLLTMHGQFWKFPKTFSAANSAGIAPRSTYLKVVGDFCRWQDRIILGCDDTAQSEFLNQDRLKGKLAGPGKSQSNLWFVEPARLDGFGPALGRGAVWLEDDVKAGVPSEPFLLSGFTRRSLHLTHQNRDSVGFKLEIDAAGDGHWQLYRELDVAPNIGTWLEFPPQQNGVWIRVAANRDATKVTAFFHYRALDNRPVEASSLFDGIASSGAASISGGLLYARGGDHKTLRMAVDNDSKATQCYDLDAELKLRRVEDPAGVAWLRTNVPISATLMTADPASWLYVDAKGKRWRLPRGSVALDRPGPLGPDRLCREVCTERNLLNVGGTFYELPAENAGGFNKLRPIATHNRRIHDFASYRGLLVLSGIAAGATGERIIHSQDGKAALWVGAVDDLWAFGKPRGRGGPWLQTAVKANAPSDAYLATGYDHKHLFLSHEGKVPVTFKVEADFAGTGQWSEVNWITVAPSLTVQHRFPDAFGAYWLRVTAMADTVATAQFEYF